jgi:hypothetical protein
MKLDTGLPIVESDERSEFEPNRARRHNRNGG